jgi:hypothetical protein
MAVAAIDVAADTTRASFPASSFAVSRNERQL